MEEREIRPVHTRARVPGWPLPAAAASRPSPAKSSTTPSAFLEALEPRTLLSAAPDDSSALLASLGVTTTASNAPAALVAPASTLGPRWSGSTTSPSPTNQAAHSLLRLDALRADSRFSTLTGRGFSSVILDTGINPAHSFFGPDRNSDGIADRIVYQYDFADNDPDATDRNGHGSNIAGLLASSDAGLPGIAPDANLIALKVFSDRGTGGFGAIESALQWVITNADRYNIASVNLSLGDGNAFTAHTELYGISDELAALSQLNIIVVAAAGNNYYSLGSIPGIAYPAADPSVISVGAVIDRDLGSTRFADGAAANTSAPDRIAPFSQRWTGMDIFAPGEKLTGAGPAAGAATTTLSGTSQATPQIAGLAVLAQQLATQQLGRRLTTAEFRSLLTSSATTIVDGDDEDDNVSHTHATYRRADALALAQAITDLVAASGGRVHRAPTLTALTPLTGAIAGRSIAITFDSLSAAATTSDPDGDPVSFRLASITSGILRTAPGLAAAARPGTVLTPGSTWYWTPANAAGWQSAITILATDGTLDSALPLTLRIHVTLATPTPLLASISTNSAATPTADAAPAPRQLTTAPSATTPQISPADALSTTPPLTAASPTASTTPQRTLNFLRPASISSLPTFSLLRDESLLTRLHTTR